MGFQLPVKHFSKSSYDGWEYCEAQWFIYYMLRFPQQSNKAADKGTITHKVLEILAHAKKHFDETGDTYMLYNDEVLSDYPIDKNHWLDESQLSSYEIDMINYHRSDRWSYPEKCQLEYGHTRKGVTLVEDLFDKVYTYYIEGELSQHKWNDKDRLHTLNWTWMVLDHANGLYDPRQQDIFDAELRFEYVIKEDWAKYQYKIDGEEVEDYLKITGFIDLVIKLDDETLEFIDYKTGQRKDWAKNKRKEYEDVENDFQLKLYYYALRKLYPEYPHIGATLYYVKDGGPYTFFYEDSVMDEVEECLRSRMKTIQNAKHPRMCDPLQEDKKCSRCDYYKQKSPCGTTNMCRFIHHQIADNGIEDTIGTWKKPKEEK